MDISEAGIAFIKQWEGFNGQQYDDCAGFPTIGYGHLLKAGERWPAITEAQGDTLLRRDLQVVTASLNNTVPVPISQNQFDALCSFCYNLGPNVLHGSTMFKCLQAADYQGAADQFPLWCHANGQVVQGLLNRRNAERALFLTPDAS